MREKKSEKNQNKINRKKIFLPRLGMITTWRTPDTDDPEKRNLISALDGTADFGKDVLCSPLLGLVGSFGEGLVGGMGEALKSRFGRRSPASLGEVQGREDPGFGGGNPGRRPRVAGVDGHIQSRLRRRLHQV